MRAAPSKGTTTMEGAHRGIAPVDRLRPAFVLSAILVVLLIAVSIPGIFIAGFYHDTPAVTATDRGNDLVSLLLIAPALAVSLAYSMRGSLRAQIIWLGLTGWAAYNFAIYAYGLNFTPMFLVQVAILSLAIFILAIVIRRVDTAGLATQFGTVPRRTVAGFLWLVAAVFGFLWLSDVIPATLSGGTPAALAKLKATSNPVEVNDLAIIVPMLVVAGLWTWVRRPVGYLLAGVMLVMATATLGAIVPGGPLFGGVAFDPMYAAVALVSLLLLVTFLSRVPRVAGTVSRPRLAGPDVVRATGAGASIPLGGEG